MRSHVNRRSAEYAVAIDVAGEVDAVRDAKPDAKLPF